MVEWQEHVSPIQEQPAESATESIWKHNADYSSLRYGPAPRFPALMEDITVDVAIVGAGITGITTALLLQKAGYDVAVLDAHPVGYGVSGFNSGHLTSMLLDMKYKHILGSFGEDATRAVVIALNQAIDFVERTVRDYRIECGFKRVPGYLYAELASQLKGLQEDYEAAETIGLRVSRTFNVPLPFEVEEAILVPDQAVFDPLRYVQALALRFTEQGGLIFENSRVVSVANDVKNDVKQAAEGAGCNVQTESGAITCQDVVLATHTPIGFRPAIQSRLEAMRSYVIGIRSDDPMDNHLDDALYWDMADPYHYIRLANDERGPLVIIGGEDHKTGERQDTELSFRRLEQYARERFQITSIDYRWSAQFYNPADGLPYIGKLSGVYVATGYSGEGLSIGTLAGRLIAEQIEGRHSECGEILNPNRTKPLASVGGFLSENLGAMAHFVKDRLKKAPITAPEEILVGEGAICTLNGRKVAAYHGSDGVLHYLSPVCTHMNCLVGWNATEKSWDCPCHGGRFDATGKVLNGPPVVDLQPINPDLLL